MILKSKLKNQRGSAAVFMAIALTAIMGFTALVIDVGLLFIERSKLSNAVDAATLAGAQELPTSPNKAINEAQKIAKVNGVPLDKVNITITNDNSKIHINGSSEVEFIFAKVFGLDKTTVGASSTAIVGPATASYGGIRPLVVERQTLVYGQQVVLKENAGDGMSGNYGAVRLGGSGAKDLETDLIYGYNGKLQIGDVIYTETGNVAGPVYDGVDYVTSGDFTTFELLDRKSKKIWIMPVVDSLDVSGNKPVTVVGFATFFVEGAARKSGQTEIKGRFIEFATNADIDLGQTDYGLKGIKLVN